MISRTLNVMKQIQGIDRGLIDRTQTFLDSLESFGVHLTVTLIDYPTFAVRSSSGDRKCKGTLSECHNFLSSLVAQKRKEHDHKSMLLRIDESKVRF